jgi:exodeoxyribonuclease V beta subunit
MSPEPTTGTGLVRTGTSTGTPPTGTPPTGTPPTGTEPAAFDLAGPLPRGLTLLEASAGTGKTFAIAALATRYVAEGVPLDRLLVVTFTRAATGELRDRVRRRLVGGLRAVDRHLAGLPPDGDAVHGLLTTGPREEVQSRQRRLAIALADFDRATIVTTHAFCEEVLRGLGTAGDVARDVTFLEDASDLLGEAVDDFYVRKFARQEWEPEFDYRIAARIAEAATSTPGIDVEPRGAPRGSAAYLRYRFATNVRVELARRKQLANTLGYDDVLRSLADSLDPGGATAARLRDRFQVVLVDEFQDTDPTQWRILQRAFLRPSDDHVAGRDPATGDPATGGGTTVILVGDPKQAIYSFRGADVFTYLEAAAQATDRRTLPVNWRSDRGLLEGIDALLDGAALGHAQIRCRPARAADANQQSRLAGGSVNTPVRVRVLSGRDGRLGRDFRGAPSVESVRHVIADDLAADVVALLSSGGQLSGPVPERHPAGPVPGGRLIEPDPGGAPPSRSLVPGDIAVLVGTNRGAALVRRALESAGVPAVIHGGGNVFATPVAIQWLQLLEALERPTSAGRARAAAVTDFVGWDALRLAAAHDPDIGALQATLHVWASVLERQGVGALMEVITVATGLPSRVLRRPDGERLLTDIHHIGELLHAEAVAAHLGTAALAAWVRRRIGEGEQTDAAEERSRRLESDADAVQVLTIHRSKGLEFPVVYLPDLADHLGAWGLPTYHDPETGRRTLDVGGEDDDDNPDYRRHRGLFEDEQRGEDLRRAYVALTRARQQVTLWWGPFRSQALSPLTRLLLADRDEGGMMRPKGRSDEDAVVARLVDAAGRAPGRIAVEPATHEPLRQPWTAPAAPAEAELDVRVFDRSLDTAWRRTSYTAITAPVHHPAPGEPAVGSEAEDEPLADEIELEPTGAVGPSDAQPAEPEVEVELEVEVEAEAEVVPSPMGGLEKGPAFGVLVHAVLERVAFDSPDLPTELASVIAAAARFAPPGVDRSRLARALEQVIHTPLGPTVGERRLRDLSRADRLDELGFELPLAGGDVPHTDTPHTDTPHTDTPHTDTPHTDTPHTDVQHAGLPRPTVTVRHIADLLRRELDRGDPLAGYAERLADPALGRVLRGYLTGSIDLLFRFRPGDRPERGRGRPTQAPPDVGSPPPRADDRFVVVDYKTNWLGPAGGALSTWHYRPAALADAMAQAHYPLQALLYSVALHRYLRWRLPGYDPERNLGGVLYLFVRGLAGTATPRVEGQPCGVFAWHPPARLVTALSDLFDQGPA